MNNVVWIMIVVLVTGLAGSQTGWAQVVNGVRMGQVTPGEVHDIGIPDGAVTGLINFDGVTATCAFLDTVALSTELSSQGVVFSGPGSNDGGAVLDQCSSFTVSGFSPPNFLAFNTLSTYPSGGTARGPETLTFTQPQSRVEINGGGADAGTITMQCFNGAGTSIGSDVITSTTAVQNLSVTVDGIERCVLSFTGPFAVFDDLAFAGPVFVRTVPTVSQWGMLGLGLLLSMAAVGQIRARRRSR